MTDPARQWSDSKYAYACCPGPHARDSAVSIGVVSKSTPWLILFIAARAAGP